MAARDGVYYVKDAPTIRLNEGMFHICYSVGEQQFEFVMRPSVFAKTRRAANQAQTEFNDRDSVVSFKDADAGH